LRRLRERFPRDLVVIGVHSAKFPSESLTANIRQAARREGIQHPIVNDAGFQIWNEYAVRAWPTLVLINPQGKIVHTESGEIEAEAWFPRLEAVLAGPTPTAEAGHPTLNLGAPVQPAVQPATLLSYPSKIIAAPDRTLYVADTANHRILELRLDGQPRSGGKPGAEIRRAFGSGQAGLQDGPAETASFHHPRGLALYGLTLYVADTGNHCLRAVDLLSGAVRTLAGTGQKGGGRADPGSPTAVPLRSPWGMLAVPGDPSNGLVLFIAMAGSHQIWVLLENGRLGVFAGNGREALVDGPPAQASFNQPSDLAYGLGHLFVADAEASAVRAISLSAEAKVFTLVGMGLFEYGDIDGAGSEVRLQHPTGLAFAGEEPVGEAGAPNGLLYLADTYNHKIKTLDPFTGRVEALIGRAEPGSEDGPFETASLYGPEGLAVFEKRLYIADTNNHLIRVADLEQRTLRTLALRGMERLPQTVPPHSLPERLAPVTLAPGRGEIQLDLRLPEGYKLNPEAPIALRLADGAPSQVHIFQPGESLALPVDSHQAGEVAFDLTFYYCQAEDDRLCLIHDRRLVLPVHISAEAPASARVVYRVEERGTFAQPSA
jgi:sugar lactone lactonase YvrE